MRSNIILSDEEFEKYLANELGSFPEKIKEEDEGEDDFEEDELIEEKDDDNVISVIPSYLKTVGQYPLFTPEEEIKYGKMLKGSETEHAEAEEKFILHNLRLVINLSKRYYYFGVSMEDLIQEGTIGLMKAVRHYDVDLGYRFSTYATWWIKQTIQRAIYDTGRIIRLPVHMQDRLVRYRKLKRQMELEGITLTYEELAERLHTTAETVKKLERYDIDATSLNLPIGDEEDSELVDFIKSPAKSTEEIYLETERKEVISKLLDCLSEREREVIELRFGIKDDEPKTLEEIAGRYNITRERVRQIEGKALKKLKHPARIKTIINYSPEY